MRVTSLTFLAFVALAWQGCGDKDKKNSENATVAFEPLLTGSEPDEKQKKAMAEMADLDDEKFKAAAGPVVDAKLADKASYEKLKDADGKPMEMQYDAFKNESEENKKKVKDMLIEMLKTKCKAAKEESKKGNQS